MAQQFVMAGVMGWPVAHSRSPVIHNHWIRKYGLNGSYGLFPVRPERLEAALRGLSALGMAGCNITLPHKVQAMQWGDHVDPLGQRMGAINLVVVQADGALHGFNTDGYGFIQSLRDAKPDWRPEAGPIVVLGGGGAARAILEAAGIHDILSKSMGSDNAINIVHATVAALKMLEAPEAVAARRGLPLEDVAPAALLRAKAGVSA